MAIAVVALGVALCLVLLWLVDDVSHEWLTMVVAAAIVASAGVGAGYGMGTLLAAMRDAEASFNSWPVLPAQFAALSAFLRVTSSN